MSEFQLQRPIQVTFLNLDKREIEDQILQPGMFIADMFPAEDALGNRTWHFMASNDGKSWYEYRSYENPEEREEICTNKIE